MAKKKSKSAKFIMEEYDKKYGTLPMDTESILMVIKDRYPKLDMNKVIEQLKFIDEIPWKEESYVVPIIPKPAARPRYSFETEHFYVPGSSVNKTIMKTIVGISDNLIYSRANILMNAFIPTPAYTMKPEEVYLSELGAIRPLIDPDVDNVLKAYLDAIQGVLIAEDNIVTDSDVHKFFSLKPRLEIRIRYQTMFDSRYNQKVIEKRLQSLEEKKARVK